MRDAVQKIMATGITRRAARRLLREVRPLSGLAEVVIRSDGVEVTVDIPKRRESHVREGTTEKRSSRAPAPEERRPQGKYVSDFASK